MFICIKSCKPFKNTVKTLCKIYVLLHIFQSHSVGQVVFGGLILAPVPYVWHPCLIVFLLGFYKNKLYFLVDVFSFLVFLSFSFLYFVTFDIFVLFKSYIWCICYFVLAWNKSCFIFLLVCSDEKNDVLQYACAHSSEETSRDPAQSDREEENSIAVAWRMHQDSHSCP